MNICSILHYLAILALLIPPFFLSSAKGLLVYIILAIIVVLHWKFNNNECILTNLEKELYPQEFNQESEHFISKHLKEWGLERVASFKYLIEALLLVLILIATVRVYRSL